MSRENCHHHGVQSLGAVVARYVTIVLSTALFSTSAQADRPYGWVNAGHVSAYTLDAFELSVSGSLIKVNSDIDLLNLRDDVVGGSSRLTGNSGDLDGFNGEIQFGVTSWLTALYREQHHDISLRLTPSGRVDIPEIDDTLTTRQRQWGLRWNIYEAGLVNRSLLWQAASLEVVRTENRSKDFNALIERVQMGSSTTVEFRPPQTFSIDRMTDRGWTARMLLTWPVTNNTGATVWGGYSQFDSQSGTSSTVRSTAIAPAFEQLFTTRQKQLHAGASIHWNITTRLPLQLGYEYISIQDHSMEIERNPSSVVLPSILRAGNLRSPQANHIVYGNLTYWLTPQLNATVFGHFFRNQFSGVMPHFNNPLSASLSNAVYGYAGIRVTYNLQLFSH